MSLAGDIIVITLLYSAFGAFHSLLASRKVKTFVGTRCRNCLPFYRLMYNGIALVSFVVVFAFMPKPDGILYDLPYPWDFIMLVPQFTALGFLAWSFKSFSLSEFVGISQVLRYFRGEYRFETLDEELTFRADGLYGITRHPVYLFSILFLAFRPVMDVFYGVFLFLTVLYFYIGAYYEEKRLTAIFGDSYKEYQSRVPMIFPFFKFRS